VRYVGVSNETSWGVAQFCAAAAAEAGLPKIVSIQNSYSLLNRGAFETDLAEVCSPSNTNVGLLAYSPLAGGSLSGKYIGTTEAPPNSRFTLFAGYMERYNRSLAREAVAAYADVAAAHGVSPATLALQFVRDRAFVTSSIIGATSLAQLKENIDAFEAPPLSPEARAAIAAVYKRFRDPATDA
jgi:aryl-alcohol dehydrogenase-like predicted oxidoreductase